MRKPLTAREEAALVILRDAMESGRHGLMAHPDLLDHDFEHYRRRLLRVLSHTWQRRPTRTK